MTRLSYRPLSHPHESTTFELSRPALQVAYAVQRVVPVTPAPFPLLGPRRSPRRLSACAVVALVSLGMGSACGGTKFTSKDGEGSGGAAGSGGASAAACTGDRLSFKLDTVVPDRNCIPSPECGPTWITIKDETGATVSSRPACDVFEMRCETCEPTPCPDETDEGCGSVVFDRPLTFVFDGSFVTDTEGECGQELAPVACLSDACAAPGDYTASICLERAVPPDPGDSECVPAGSLECFDVPFSWPQSGEIVLTVGDDLN